MNDAETLAVLDEHDYEAYALESDAFRTKEAAARQNRKNMEAGNERVQ